ncbi:unnamed protein product [Paramecium pentaurelia]|uniref:Transmembrane protein n=1 Tax=Paramecium pentaurelia TaxID=43138 RepID=A0A8S1SGR2_9CILI|nr:unnamed protein product [Paramecium pentaurelia]
MLFFLSFIIINDLQLELQLYDYQKGDITYTAYSLNRFPLKLLVQTIKWQYDNINPYSLIYSKNPINNYQCIHCPSIKSDSFEKLLISESTTLQNSNKCILTKNENKLNIKIRISCWINLHFDNFQICLTYDISNQQYKQNLVMSSTQLIESQNKSKRFYQIKQFKINRNYNSNYFKRIFNNLKKKIINFDLTTKNNYLPQILSKRQNPIKKNYQSSEFLLHFFSLEITLSIKFKKIQIEFNGLSNTQISKSYFFRKINQNVNYIYSLQSTSSILGNQFVYNIQFKRKQNHNWIINQDIEDKIKFSNHSLYCLLKGFLMLFRLLSLMIILNQILKLILNKISLEQLLKPKYEQRQPNPLQVVSKTQNIFKPYNIELSTNQQMVYSKR